MSGSRRLWRFAMGCAAFAASVCQATAQDPAPVPTVTARVDRPAIWIADRVTYTVEITCPRGLDILVEDLGRHRLKLTGLEIVSTSTARVQDGDLTRYVADYVLTTYRVDVPRPSVGSFPVRYYLARAGQRPQEAAPAGSVLVPEVAVAFRSLLPDDQPAHEPRDPQSVPARWIVYRSMELAGLGLILIALAPAVLLLVRLGRGARTRRRRPARPSERQARQAARAALDGMLAMEVTNVAARREAFARLASLIRQHVADRCGVAAEGLTPDDVAAAIEPCAERLPIELVMAVLSACELAQYGTPDLQPTVDDWRRTLDQAGQVLFAGR